MYARIHKISARRGWRQNKGTTNSRGRAGGKGEGAIGGSWCWWPATSDVNFRQTTRRLYAKLSRLRVYILIYVPDIDTDWVCVCVCLGGWVLKMWQPPSDCQLHKKALTVCGQNWNEGVLGWECVGAVRACLDLRAALQQCQTYNGTDSASRGVTATPAAPTLSPFPSPLKLSLCKCTLQQCKTNTRATTEPIVIALWLFVNESVS